MYWGFDCLILLRLYLNFKNNIFNENFFSFWLNIFNKSVSKLPTLIRFLQILIITSQLSNIFFKMKVDSILNDFKPLNEIILQNIFFIHVNYILISNFSFYPIWLITLFTIIINIFTSKHNTSFYYVIWFNNKFRKSWKLFGHISNYLNLLTLDRIWRVFNLNISLNGFLFFDYLSILIFNLNKNEKGELLERGNFVSEITGMLINRNPDAHSMRIH